MSCVVGYKYGSNVYMVYDSIEYAPEDGTFRKTSMDKCFLKDNILFGIVGSIRAVSVIKYKFKIPLKPKGMDDIEYLSTDFTDELIKILEKNECINTCECGEKVANCTILLGYNNKLYEVFQDFYIGEVIDPPYESIGSNSQFAMGSMYALQNDEKLKPEEKLMISLEAVKQFSTTVCYPFKILRI